MTPTAYQIKMASLFVKGAPPRKSPPAGTGTSAEIGDGTTGFYPGKTTTVSPAAIGYAEFVFNVPNVPTVTEQWVIINLNAWRTGELTFQHLSADPKKLNAALRQSLKTEFGANLQTFSVTFNFLPMPSATAIGGLPDANPQGVTGRYFELRTVHTSGSFSGTPNGYLYREEIVSTVGGVSTTNYSEHYVLLGSYFMPEGTDLGRFSPVTSGAPTTLKAFLNAAVTVVNAQSATDKANTRYVQTQFTLTPL